MRDLSQTFTLVQPYSVWKISRQAAYVDGVDGDARFGQERIRRAILS